MTAKPGTIEVDGAARLESTLKHAADELRNLDATDDAAARIVATKASSLVPKVTGTLAASQSVAGGTVTYAAPYAGVIHGGWPARNITAQPWLTEAGDTTETERVTVYAINLEHTIDKVAGV